MGASREYSLFRRRRDRGKSGDRNAAAVRAGSPSKDYRMMMESRSGPTET